MAVYDVSKNAMDSVTSKGAKACSSAADVASNSDIVFTMLPNNDIVYESYAGKDGVFKGAKKNALLVDSSTISPDVAKRVCSEAKNSGLSFIDAPVSGGKVRFWRGSLGRLIVGF